MASSLFGWDLLYKTIEKDVKNEQDILLCLTHFVLISNGFSCIGLGESKVIDGSEDKTETLPDGWNDEYTLRYVHQGRLYNLKGTKLDDGIMINLMRIDERTVSLVQLNSQSVSRRSGTLKEMIPNNDEIIKLIKKQLVDKVVVSKKLKDNCSQTSTGVTPSYQETQSTPSSTVFPPFVRDPFIDPVAGPTAGLGRNDLYPFGFDPLRGPNPLGPGGGGMLFDPMRPFPSGGPTPGVPPGSVPPGARFDPFRAPDDRFPPRRPPNRPDNDEMPPPGYDDMFM